MSSETTNHRTKVARVIDEYGLDGKGAEFEAAWTRESGDRTSLRDLADELNEAALEAALREAGVSTLDFEVTGTYESLQDGAGPATTRARRRLERNGVDPDAIARDFVTHQAIHTYLTKERGASLPEDDGDTVAQRVDTIEKLQGRLNAVTESAISELATAAELDRDDYDVLVDVRAVCPNCGSDHVVGTLLREGSCDCTADTTGS
jgi:hypothetical protein